MYALLAFVLLSAQPNIINCEVIDHDHKVAKVELQDPNHEHIWYFIGTIRFIPRWDEPRYYWDEETGSPCGFGYTNQEECEFYWISSRTRKADRCIGYTLAMQCLVYEYNKSRRKK